MLNLTQELQFKYPWRDYQANFLKNLDEYIIDHHLHLIAPPGSGKTILGIEIVRRVNKKALVLAPTLTIRNQWKERLISFFSKNNSFQDYSFDINKPEQITFSTYQSLHAFYKSFEDKNKFFSFFHDQGLECIVLDEAHHLKNEWWKCLMALKEDKHFTVVALTATPPFDSEEVEISRYFSLCGPVDEEISVPGLVKEGDLCPHQDFVYFSKPDEAIINAIAAYRNEIADFVDKLKANNEFLQLLLSHRFYEKTEEFLMDIYEHPQYFSALLIFLNASGIKVSKKKLEVLGFENEKIDFPDLSYDWAEVLLQNLIINDRANMPEAEQYLEKLENWLRKLSILEKGKVNIEAEKRLFKSLVSSPVKINSIVEICNFEYKNLSEGLRCVVLADYIRKEFLNTPDDSLHTINRLGVVPVFRHLRKKFINKSFLAVLSGSLVILNKKSLEYEFNTKDFIVDFNISEWQPDPDFLIITAKNSGKNKLTALVTRLFEQGRVKILIGTKSLLGEGWDAPGINSLILASFVGSFVTSNQMRGRAIRSQKDNADKTGIIWHLATIDPTAEDGGNDLARLKRRFEAFVGISQTEPVIIENGFERLGLPENFKSHDYQQLNTTTFKNAKNRKLITEKWLTAIYKGSHMARELKVASRSKLPHQKQMKLYYRDMVMYMVAELILGISMFLPEFLIRNVRVMLEKGILYVIYLFLIALALGFGKKLITTIYYLIKYGTRHKKVDKICKSVIMALSELGHIVTPLSSIKVDAVMRNDGGVVCIVKGTSKLEGELIIRALDEALSEIENPRYLLITTSFWRRFLKLEQMYPVPDIFGGKKEHATIFLRCWKQNLGKSSIVFTRNLKGRKLLLRARISHIGNAFKRKNKKAVIWK